MRSSSAAVSRDLPMPGLTREQHHLAFAALCLRPTPQQHFEFFFPPDKFRQAARVQCLEAAFHRSRSQRRPGSHRPCDALEVLCPKVLKLEQIAQELSGALSNHDAVRLRNALQARGKVWRLANDGLLLRSARSDQIADDHQSRCDADTRLQGRVGLQTSSLPRPTPVRRAPPAPRRPRELAGSRSRRAHRRPCTSRRNRRSDPRSPRRTSDRPK